MSIASGYESLKTKKKNRYWCVCLVKLCVGVVDEIDVIFVGFLMFIVPSSLWMESQMKV